MLEETAKVIDINDGLLTLETESRSGCKQCGSHSCTTSIVAKLFGIRRNRMIIDNSLDAKKGDQVVIGIPEDLLVQASVMAYLLPLVLMLMVTALGEALSVNEVLLSMLALGGLVTGFFMVRLVFHRTTSRQRYRPQLLRIAASEYQRVEIPTFTGVKQ
ncbi:MAG: SoxR reducing system RseC family protein [Candidatus Thiodiazotropha sp. (ex Notomyrtea botanica)]|nr:SoxR reducing system RseC family protein [Candidatus Thiodiazotropha sp. (ex Notomyrtea botanica)]